MNRLIGFFALAALTTTSHACPPPEKGRRVEKEACVTSKADRKTDADRIGITAADKENLGRAMSRNVLQSIDDQLRRQRFGN